MHTHARHYIIYFTTQVFCFVLFFFSSVCRSCKRIVGLLSVTCPLWWVELQLSAVAFTFENKISTLWTTAHRTQFEVWQFVLVSLFLLRLKVWLISLISSWTATLKKTLTVSFAACNSENTIKFCVQSKMLKSNMNIYNSARGAPIWFLNCWQFEMSQQEEHRYVSMHCLEILNLALSLKYCPENINRVDVVND